MIFPNFKLNNTLNTLCGWLDVRGSRATLVWGCRYSTGVRLMWFFSFFSSFSWEYGFRRVRVGCRRFRCLRRHGRIAEYFYVRVIYVFLFMWLAEWKQIYFLFCFWFSEGFFWYNFDGVYFFWLHAFYFITLCESSLSEEATLDVSTDNTVPYFAIALFYYLLVLSLNGIISWVHIF